MKRVLLLFSFLALVLAGVVSADRVPGACCPAGEAGKALQAHGHHQMDPAAHKAGGCCQKAEGAEAKGCCDKHGTDADAKGGCCEKHRAEGAKKGCCEKTGAAS